MAKRAEDEIAICALSSSSIHAASFDPRCAPDAKDITHACREEEVVDQEQTGTCWLQAGLSLLSSLARRRGVTARFSLTHLVYYDKLGKAECFLRAYVALPEEPDEACRERRRWHLMNEPIGDGGTWPMFVALVRAYGLVPHDARLPLRQATHSGQLNRYLNDYLRGVAARASPDSIPDLLRPVETALRRAYGPPGAAVALFATEHGRDFEGTPCELGRLVRREWPYHVLTHAPDREEGWYVGPGRNLPTMEDRFVCVHLDALVAACVEQLEHGVPVWCACDVRFDFCAMRGVAAVGLFKTEALLGLPRMRDKAERMRARAAAPVHAMLLTGVKVVDGAPRQWRIQNSWGSDTQTYGKGFVTVTHDWFCEHMFQAAVDAACCGAAPPAPASATRLEPWDVFGTVA